MCGEYFKLLFFLVIVLMNNFCNEGIVILSVDIVVFVFCFIMRLIRREKFDKILEKCL